MYIRSGLVSEPTYRVVQWATGSIGQIAIRHFAENPSTRSPACTSRRMRRTVPTPARVRSGEIAKGTVAGMRHEWVSWSAGKPIIVFRSFWKMGDDLDPNWGFGTIKDSLRIEGDPALNVAFEPGGKHPTGDEGYWGRVWTAMNAVNAIPSVVAADPGIKTTSTSSSSNPEASSAPPAFRMCGPNRRHRGG